MDLLEFRATGIRCLVDIDWIPAARPTILTGPNDGGKTSGLLALEFLLTGRGISPGDFTWVLPDESPRFPVQDGRYAECWVEGRFTLDEEERVQFEDSSELLLRRRMEYGGGSVLEVWKRVPTNARLRDLVARTLVELKAIAEEVGKEPEGPGNRKDSYLAPLQKLAESGPHTEAWVQAPAWIVERLPRIIAFASTAEPDPEAEIRQALREAYARALEDPSLVAPVRKVE